MKVLVIDDEFEARETIKNILSDSNTETLCVADAVSALLALKDHDDIEVIITDYRLPGLGGRNWIELLKHYHPTLNVIVISGYDIVMDNLSGKLDVKILKKPVNKQKLLKAIGPIR